MAEDADPVDDETTITEITVQPDGRVYVFGASRPVLELLADLWPGDEKVRLLLGRGRLPAAAGDDASAGDAARPRGERGERAGA